MSFPDPLVSQHVPPILFRVTSNLTAGGLSSITPPFLASYFFGCDRQIEAVFPNQAVFSTTVRKHLTASRHLVRDGDYGFKSPFVSVTRSLRYALAVAWAYMHARDYKDINTITITVIDTSKLAKSTRIWSAKQLTKSLQLRLPPTFNVEDEYLIYQCVTYERSAWVINSEEPTAVRYEPLEPLVKILRSDVEKLDDCDPTFSDFWTKVPVTTYPENEILRASWELAKSLCIGSPELCIPLLIQASHVPSRQKRGHFLSKAISFHASKMLQEKPGALQAYYGSISGADHKEEEEICIYDFHRWSSRMTVPDESAEAAATSKCLKWLSKDLHKAQEREVLQQCDISVMCHLLSTMADPLIRELLAAADQGREATLSGDFFSDKKAVRLRDTFISFKTEFMAYSFPAQSSLRWLADQLEKTRAQIQKQPEKGGWRQFWQHELEQMLKLLSPSKKRPLDEEIQLSQASNAYKTPRPKSSFKGITITNSTGSTRAPIQSPSHAGRVSSKGVKKMSAFKTPKNDMVERNQEDYQRVMEHIDMVADSLAADSGYVSAVLTDESARKLKKPATLAANGGRKVPIAMNPRHAPEKGSPAHSAPKLSLPASQTFAQESVESKEPDLAVGARHRESSTSTFSAEDDERQQTTFPPLPLSTTRSEDETSDRKPPFTDLSSELGSNPTMGSNESISASSTELDVKTEPNMIAEGSPNLELTSASTATSEDSHTWPSDQRTDSLTSVTDPSGSPVKPDNDTTLVTQNITPECKTPAPAAEMMSEIPSRPPTEPSLQPELESDDEITVIPEPVTPSRGRRTIIIGYNLRHIARAPDFILAKPEILEEVIEVKI